MSTAVTRREAELAEVKAQLDDQVGFRVWFFWF
jgi:hypothetical protein